MSSSNTLTYATSTIDAFVAAHTPLLEAQPDVLTDDDGDPREPFGTPSVTNVGNAAVVTTGSCTVVYVSPDDWTVVPPVGTVGIPPVLVKVSEMLLLLAIERDGSCVTDIRLSA